MQLKSVISSLLLSVMFSSVAFCEPRRGQRHNEVEIEGVKTKTEIEVHHFNRRVKTQKSKEVDVVVG